ncbi:hypothetical protein JL720_16010 [Aureococcus anophagefferens]|nr:hypothetical protein JL720_16010 [Aureococcus anophagefferens]
MMTPWWRWAAAPTTGRRARCGRSTAAATSRSRCPTGAATTAVPSGPRVRGGLRAAPELASQHVVGERRLVCLTRLGVEELAKLQALSTPVQELRNALRDEPALAVATRRDVLAAERAAQRRWPAGGPPARAELPTDEAARDAEAARREARELHVVYRLVSRATQALALGVLGREAGDRALAEATRRRRARPPGASWACSAGRPRPRRSGRRRPSTRGSSSDVLPAAAPGASPPALATACDALRVHGCAAAAVEVALAARRTAPRPSRRRRRRELAGDHWELALYRGRPPDGAQRRDEDAREACHDVALDALKRELWRCGAAATRDDARGDGADGALLACCGAKRGPFLDRCLEAAKAADDRRLVKLPLDAAEVYRRGPGLLWRHHLAHGEDARAAALMEDLATAPGGDLDARVSCLRCLRRAADLLVDARDADAEAAAARAADGEPGGEAAQLHDAGLENERALDLERVAATLEERLVGVSELYNDVASRYGMWDLCLVTLKVCGHDDEPLAVKL